MSDSGVYDIVPARPEHLNMILSQWMRTLRHGNAFFKMIDSRSYYDAYNLYIRAILARPGCVASVAELHATDETGPVAIGWRVSQGPVLHYLYVQKQLRRAGVATALMPKGITHHTHITRMGEAALSTIEPLIFNPFL